LPNCRQRNASIASGIQLALRGMRSVTTLNDTSSDPVVDPVGCSNRGGKIALWRPRGCLAHMPWSVVDMGAPPSCRAALIQAADRLTLERNCQGEDVKSYRRSERDGGKG
jgi:hypothetical protein